jgi:Mrp family chromosome partitioning ATPase
MRVTRRAVEQLRQVGGNVAGIVLTDIDRQADRYGSYYYYDYSNFGAYYDAESENGNAPRRRRRSSRKQKQAAAS